MRSINKINPDEIINSILLVAGIAILGIIVVIATRFQRGLLAFALSAVAGGLLIFWLFELKRTLRSSKPVRRSKWTYDLIAADDEITFVAEVPGPDDSVAIELANGKLRVTSSRDFAKEIEFSEQVELVGSTYVNGILNVKLRKIKRS